MLTKMNGGVVYKDDNEDLQTRPREAWGKTRHLLDSKGILLFFSLLFSQPEIYSGIGTAFNSVPASASCPQSLVPKADVVSPAAQLAV